MKITFEGKTFDDIIAQMEDVLEVADARGTGAVLEPPGLSPEQVVQVRRDVEEVRQKVVDKPVDKPVEKRGRTEKQLANDEKLRERAQAKKAAGLKPFDKMPKAPVEKSVEHAEPNPMEDPPFAPVIDPAEVVRIRQKTIVDLQEAYANGHQQEVFELLSRFGNGAKSFRELPPESFVPIRDAIDKGALT